MEPRFFNHGDTFDPGEIKNPREDSLNGATVFQPWRPLIRQTTTVLCPSLVSMEPRFFNHGDVEHEYTLIVDGKEVSMEPRFFNHGDGGHGLAHQRGGAHAVSMEPRFFNHGDAWLYGRPYEIIDCPVSMEPRFFNHGDPTPRSTCACEVRFQWSHGFSTMETWWSLMACRRISSAFQWSHGFSTMETDLNPR